MQVYIDNDKNTISLVQSVASASTMISSVAIQAKDFVLSKFPKKYFKHVYINTSQTITQQSYNEKYNKNANKIRYPSMTITPVMSLDDPIGAMEKSMHLSSPNLYLRKDINRAYNKLVVDPERKFSIYYTSDYITTNFDFSITTNTYIQNVDIAHYLKSRFQSGFFQYLNECSIQTEIPKSLIAMIADVMNYDLNDADDMDSLRLYLIGTSLTKNSIQKKVNTGTGKQCFFLDQVQNFLVLFTDLDCPPSVIRDNQSEGEYQINFRLQVSCWVPNAFILNMNKKLIGSLSGPTKEYLESDENQQENGFLSLNLFSGNAQNILTKNDTVYFTDNSGSEQIGTLVFYQTFAHELNKGIDKINILYDQKSEFGKIYNYAVEEGNLDLSSLICIKVYTSAGAILNEEDYWVVDYENLTINFINDVSEILEDRDFVIALYVNRLAYESLKKAYLSDTFYFNSNFLTTVYAKTIEFDDVTGDSIEKPIKLVVRSFSSSKEKNSADDNYSLRVNTAYGIGYIGLLTESNEQNSYKICIGFDENDEPMIRNLETKEV